VTLSTFITNQIHLTMSKCFKLFNNDIFYSVHFKRCLLISFKIIVNFKQNKQKIPHITGLRCCSLRCGSTSLIGSGRSVREVWCWVNRCQRFAVSVGTATCFIGTVGTLLRTVTFSLLTYTGTIAARECTRWTPLTLNINKIAIYRYMYAYVVHFLF